MLVVDQSWIKMPHLKEQMSHTFSKLTTDVLSSCYRNTEIPTRKYVQFAVQKHICNLFPAVAFDDDD